MISVWENAEDYVASAIELPEDSKKIRLKKMVFSSGELKINYFSEQCELLGMRLDASQHIQIPQVYGIIDNFAKENCLEVNPMEDIVKWGYTSHTIYLSSSDKKTVAWLFPHMFLSSDPKLFEGLGKEIYGLV